jgi:hypothetical protein
MGKQGFKGNVKTLTCRYHALFPYSHKQKLKEDTIMLLKKVAVYFLKPVSHFTKAPRKAFVLLLNIIKESVFYKIRSLYY